MQAKVKKKFRDKYSKEVYKFGQTYEGDSKRIKELEGFGWVEKSKVNKTPVGEGE
ncbi:hypothetical protein [Cytobacillus kochii]|uniref:hypothetical protein n=1 Tax=Cytobacillus kochii TaxID=859143 RepID=UPI00402AD1F5